MILPKIKKVPKDKTKNSNTKSQRKELNDVRKESEIDAKEIIKIRYAKREITKEEYEEMKRDFDSW